jgi:hypothetical protein
MNSSSIIPIEDLKPHNKNIHVNFQVIEKISEKKINKGPNTTHNVANFKVADETGIVQLAVWNEEINEIDIGQNYVLNDGIVNVFRNQVQLTPGKNGEIKPSDVKFDKLNKKNDISRKKTIAKKKNTFKGSKRFRKKKYTEKEDDFSYKVNKKYLWACKR